MATDTSDGLSTAVPRTGLGVADVLASPRIAPPPATLDEARSARAAEQHRASHAADRGRGHQVHLLPAGLVSGHVNGKGVVATLWARSPRRATSSSTAPPPTCSSTATTATSASARRSRSWPRSPTSTPSQAAVGSARRARVLRLLRHRDRRADRVRPAPEPQADHERGRAGARLHFLCGIEPEMMWLKTDARRRRRRGRDEALVLPHPPVRGAARDHPRRRRLRRAARDRHDLRRPRGLARPARAELPLRPRRARPTTSRRTGRSARPSRASTGCCATFMPKPFTGVSANGHHHHFTLVDEHGRGRLLRPRRPGEAVGDRPLHRGDARPLPRAHARSPPRRSTRTSASGTSASGRRSTRLRLAEPHEDGARRRAAGASSSAPSTRRATRT